MYIYFPCPFDAKVFVAERAGVLVSDLYLSLSVQGTAGCVLGAKKESRVDVLADPP